MTMRVSRRLSWMYDYPPSQTISDNTSRVYALESKQKRQDACLTLGSENTKPPPTGASLRVVVFPS